MRRAVHRHALGLLLVAALLLPGCGIEHARMVRDAQDVLSVAAARENEAKFDFDPSLGGADLVDPALGYETAIGLVNQAVRGAERELKADQLYATALTIRAVAKWRLGDYDGAKSDAAEVKRLAAQPESKVKVWPRDRTICEALVPLMQVGELGKEAKQPDLKVDEWLTRSEEAAGNLHSAAKTAPQGHPIRVYLVQAELELVHVVFVGLSNHPRMATEERIARYRKLRTDAFAHLESAKAEVDESGRPPIVRMKEYYVQELPDIEPVTR